MSDSLWYEKLVLKYPNVFREIDHVETYPGWEKLLDCTCNIIEDRISKLPNSEKELHYAVQIKSKFGGLRFYMSKTDEYMDGAIAHAESVSFTICEHCGDAASVKNINGWVCTLCDLHLEKIKSK